MRVPLEAIEKSEVPEEEATVKRSSVGCVEVPIIANLDDIVVVPTPMFPLAKTVKSELPVDEATLNGLTVPAPCTVNS